MLKSSPAPPEAMEGTMIEKVHEHIISELQQNARPDTVFILTAILLNLLSLGVNSGIASSKEGSTRGIVFTAFIALVLVVNFVVINGLLKGREMRQTLINGLLRMYKDQQVEGYYDASLLAPVTANGTTSSSWRWCLPASSR